MTNVALNAGPWMTTLAALTVRSLGGSLYQLSETVHRLAKISEFGRNPLPPNRHYLVGSASDIRRAYCHLLAKRLFETVCPVLGTIIVYAREHDQLERALAYFASSTKSASPSPFWTIVRGDFTLVKMKELFLRARYEELVFEMHSVATGEGSISPRSGHFPSLASVSPIHLSTYYSEEPDEGSITPKSGFFPITPLSPFVHSPIMGKPIAEEVEIAPGRFIIPGKFKWISTI